MYRKSILCWIVWNLATGLNPWLSVLYEIIKLSVFIKQPPFSISIQKNDG